MKTKAKAGLLVQWSESYYGMDGKDVIELEFETEIILPDAWKKKIIENANLATKTGVRTRQYVEGVVLVISLDEFTKTKTMKIKTKDP